ncbi:MAG: type II secretion system protein J [Nocardioides sp.]|uniref:PulJ/GspJ family protein n=1 Tax=Nocardioides sp. TaxID=35761 RepID=UPI003F07675F
MSAVRTPAVRPRRRDERGAVLVEMVIALALTSGVLVVATMLFITGLRGNSQVTSTTQATMQAQGVAQGIELAVRNARRISLESCASVNTDCTKVTVWTTLGGDRTCQVWTVSTGAEGTVQTARGTTTPATTTAFGTGTPGATLSFPSAALNAGGKVVGLSYVVTYPSDTKPVRVSGTVRSRTPRDTTSPTTCGLPA